MSRIIILGAGFGGLRVALDLAKAGRRIEGHDVVLVDRVFHHVYTPLLYEVATGFFGEERGEKAMELWERILCKGVCIRIEQLPAIVEGKHIRFESGEVERIDRVSRRVMLSGGRELPYDYLVVALGAETDYFGIPGIREHAIPFKTARDALTLRRRIMKFAEAQAEGREEKVCVAIGGGGPTGVELAAEVTNMFRKIIPPAPSRGSDLLLYPAGYLSPEGDLPAESRSGALAPPAGGGMGPDSRPRCAVTLIEAAPRILGAFPEAIAAAVEKRLQKLGVSVMAGVAVAGVTGNAVTLANRATGEKQELEADVFVWTGGVRGNHIIAESGFSVDKKGRAPVDEFLRAAGEEQVFVIGDGAASHNPKFQTEPGLAYVAVKQGRLAAENILRMIEGKPLRRYDPLRRVDAIIPLGGKHEYAVVFGIAFHGFLAWLIRRFVDLRYFLSILPFRSALFFWLRGAKVYIQND
ncbi:MAG: NAD(P)/FAD-dependent oxidoreductase [Patescibacteria group bacterium]